MTQRQTETAQSKSGTSLPVLKPKDYASSQDVRWCPGCGDYAILNQIKKTLAKMGSRKENTVFVAGIGCSSRFPYYVDTYGFHTIHGRAPAFATGVKMANPDLDVWIVTGDGDGLSIGGNHLIHVLRRNVNVNIMLFNNRIYGLTKGQASPTSEEGKKTKSTPMGSLDMPISPISLAMAARATFVARAVDVDKGLGDILEQAAEHKGASFVEIYQDCNIFNHFAFKYATDKDTKEDNVIRLEHGKPMVYGTDRDKGIRLTGDGKPETVDLGKGISEDDLLFHDMHDESLAYLLSRMSHPEFPEPMGVFYKIEDDCHENLLDAQVAKAIEMRGEGDLAKLLHSGDTWEVTEDSEDRELGSGD
ncbi:MAG: 2-oxoacid:ferredoxin oxidoreductase subunit beta [Phycisphaeraceae bacterium]|nr:2-oxoacid:ferredoxin oxidoreductase subunit beta [Phycisphaeraceae bacterium]